MNKTLFGAIMFVAGAAIGSAATYKFVKTKYERISREEIDNVKEYFRELNNNDAHTDESEDENCDSSELKSNENEVEEVRPTRRTVGEKPDLQTVCRHFLHFMELDPSGKHIALGGDLDGITYMSEGFTGVQDYPKMAQRLLERGVGESIIRDIFWNNAIGVMERAVCNHTK